MPLDKLRAKIAWVKACPVWQKPQAAEAALDEALEVIAWHEEIFEFMNKRLSALEGGNDGNDKN